MRILVFAAKDVGLESVRFLLRRFPDDEYTFAVGEPDSEAIAALLSRAGKAFLPLSADTCAQLAAAPERYDWLLNLWAGQILKPDLLAVAHASLNIHPSLLPHGRGRDPVVWALREGTPAGVSLHAITAGVDEGPIWFQEAVPYRLPITGGALYAKVVARCIAAFQEQWPDIRSRTTPPVPQGKATTATHRRKDLFADRVIDTDDPPARDVIRKLLAHDFGPGYQARLKLDGRWYDARLELREVPAEP